MELNDIKKEFFNQIFKGINDYIGPEKLNKIIENIINRSENVSETMLNISYKINTLN